MIALDTNVLARYLLNDDPKQASAAAGLLRTSKIAFKLEQGLHRAAGARIERLKHLGLCAHCLGRHRGFLCGRLLGCGPGNSLAGNLGNAFRCGFHL